MAPFLHTPLDLPSSSPTTTSPNSKLLRRSWSTCSYYDTSCRTHRTMLLGIVIAVCILMTLIIMLLFIRHHKRRTIARRTLQTQQATTVSQIGYNYGGSNPMPTSFGGAGGRPADADVEAPPPAYTRSDKEVAIVR